MQDCFSPRNHTGHLTSYVEMNHRSGGHFKGIVSRDLGGLLMILLGRLEVFNISASRFFLFSLPFSYSNFKNGRLSGASFQHNSSKDQYKSGDSNSLA